MKTETVDLYGYYGLDRGTASGGMLRCWVVETSGEVSASRRRPAVLILPGGGYGWTSAREAEPVALRFAARGYVPFVLDYSCDPSRFPTALRESAMAMRYIRERAGVLEVNPEMVAAIGFSAGGHLCGTLGTLYDCEEVRDLGSAEQIRPDVLGLCYPVAVSWGRTHEFSFERLTGCDAQLRARLSLERLARPDMPPVFLWHTRDDPAVPCRNSLLLAAALEEAGVDFSLLVYHHGQHGLSLADEMVYPAYRVPGVSPEVPGWLDSMLEFFGECGFRITDAEVTE